jgi:hypothetical protein
MKSNTEKEADNLFKILAVSSLFSMTCACIMIALL